jgi:hypothetical protein
LFDLIKTKKLTKTRDGASPRLSDPTPYMANAERARLREFHPLELIPARAAPYHGGQPDHSIWQ